MENIFDFHFSKKNHLKSISINFSPAGESHFIFPLYNLFFAFAFLFHVSFFCLMTY